MELNNFIFEACVCLFVEVPKTVMPLFDPNMHVLLSNALLNYGYLIMCMNIADPTKLYCEWQKGNLNENLD